MNQNQSVLHSLRNRQQIRNYQQNIEERKEVNQDPISTGLRTPLIDKKDNEQNRDASPCRQNYIQPNVGIQEIPPSSIDDESSQHYREAIPQSMLRLNDRDAPDVPSNEQNGAIDRRGEDAVKQNKIQIIYLAVATAYLLVCVNYLKSANQFKIEYDEPNEGPAEQCTLDSNRIMKNFCYYVLIPTLLFRLASHAKYKDMDPLDMRDGPSQYIEIYFHGTYGMWTIYNLFRYIYVPQSCKDQRSLSMINYELGIIFGCFSAVNTLFVVIVCLIAIPFLCWHMYKDNQRLNENARKREILIKHLVIKDYDPMVFPLNVECSVCISDFESGQKVCPLPCNKLHVFHQDCILKWLSMKDFGNICPLCKQQIDYKECIELSKNFDQVYPREQIQPQP